MGMNCLLGYKSICVYDTCREDAQITAHGILKKIYSGDENIDNWVPFLPVTTHSKTFATAVTWFNEKDEVVLNVYNEVEKRIQELISREMTFYVTHGYNSTNGDFKIEERINSIILHNMLNYRDTYVTEEKFENYILGE